MLLTEFDEELFVRTIKEESREEGREEGWIAGLEEGRIAGLEEGKIVGLEKGESRINRLNSILIDAGRIDDLKRAATDTEYQAKLILELLAEES